MEKKYIIKLEENEIAYKTVNSNGCPMIGLLHPAPYTEPDLDAIRNEAWAAARKIAISEESGGLTCREMQRIFCTDETDEIFDMSASEAIEGIHQYEQKQEEIHLGDEVTFLPNNAKGIVSECHVPDIYSDNDKYAVWRGGTMEYVLKQHLTKTGRTFPEIAEILRKMKEES